ncbi:hypothetical protein VKS41_000157 [Umbelopsis sp. WA50703]
MLYDDQDHDPSALLEDELMGMGQSLGLLGNSLAAELHTATVQPSPSASRKNMRHLSHGAELQQIDEFDATELEEELPIGVHQSLAHEMFSNQASPIISTGPLSTMSSTTFGHSRSGSLSTWSSVDVEEADPFETLRRQLEELNTAVWETKTLHKRLVKTLLSNQTLSLQTPLSTQIVTDNFAPPLELVITSVVNLIDRMSRERERQFTVLRTIDTSVRTEGGWMSMEALSDIDVLLVAIKNTLHDVAFEFNNPVPLMQELNIETSAMTDSLEELKEHMFVNKRQAQELNARLRAIAKTVHDVRKDMREVNQLLAEKDDEDAVVLEKGEVKERVKEIMWGLDDLDERSSQELSRMKQFWDDFVSVAS